MTCNVCATSSIGQVTVCTTATRPTGANLYEGKVIYDMTLDALMMYDGVNWVRLGQVDGGAYTPGLTGITVGTGGSAQNIGNWSAVRCAGAYWQMHLEGFVILGTAGMSVVPAPVVGPQIPPGWSPCSPSSSPVGEFVCYDASTSAFFDGQLWLYGTTLRSVARLTTGTYSQLGDVSATVPMTWAANDWYSWSADLHVYKT